MGEILLFRYLKFFTYRNIVHPLARNVRTVRVIDQD